MTIRDDFADALSLVDGVTGYPTQPKAVRPGDAWANLSALERGPGATWTRTWRAVVVLTTSDPARAEVEVDALLDPLLDALSPVAFLSSARPVLIETGAGQLLALELTMERE